MSESERVQRWRQRQRAAGKEPLTIWLTAEEKLRLEDMALTQRCSPSELVSRMLAQWHGESQAVTDTVTDTEHLRAIVQQELAQSHSVTATETDTVTDTLLSPKDDHGRETAPERVADTVAVNVTDMVTDTDNAPPAKRKAPSRQGAVADTATVTDHALEPFDTTKYRLGTLCPRNHDYHGTGQSLRKNNKAGGCLACDAEKARERRQAKRQKVSA